MASIEMPKSISDSIEILSPD